MKLFVPGRICLFGEHTDWAGGYRRINEDVGEGYTIIAGTNQGLYADVSAHPNSLVLESTLDDGTKKGPVALPMDPDLLLAEAQKGGFFSYAAGVAHEIMTHYRVRGVHIDNYHTDLPVRKGLSSSAALCVLVARAFNRIYDLKMTRRGEMECAYRGEIATPSRCGRMDQGCAYGNRPIMMTFDGEALSVEELHVPHELYFVIVDLKAGKDTREILAHLNQAYPFAETELQRGVQEFLGQISARITHEAADALREGDAARLGELMAQAQSDFDTALQPACPSELTAPKLHEVLAYEPIQPHVLGGKGVGSGGDGTAQFIVPDAEAQARVIEILEGDLDLECLKLTLGGADKVRKAVITAAGFGTRMFPATRAIKKELFPVLDRHGNAKPAILVSVEEAVAAGIEQVAIVIQERDRAAFEELFHTPLEVEHLNRLSPDARNYSRYLAEIGDRIRFIVQDSAEGFGHAVACARQWVGEEPFLLMLGDHVYRSTDDTSCTSQLLEAYGNSAESVVGLTTVQGAEVGHFGCAAGRWISDRNVMDVTTIHEKPTLDYARERLQVAGLEGDEFLCMFGLYILNPTIFDCLDQMISSNRREDGEFQFTPALEELRHREGLVGLLVQGERFDVGLPHSYQRVIAEFGPQGKPVDRTGGPLSPST